MADFLNNKPDPAVIESIADFICGDDSEKYPEYRSSYYLTKFFQDIKINVQHDGSTRRIWVAQVLENLSLDEVEKVILRLLDLREYKGDKEKLKMAAKAMQAILFMENLKFVFNGKDPIITPLDKNSSPIIDDHDFVSQLNGNTEDVKKEEKSEDLLQPEAPKIIRRIAWIHKLLSRASKFLIERKRSFHTTNKKLSWWDKPWIKIIGFIAAVVTIISIGWSIWAYFNPFNASSVQPKFEISNLFIETLRSDNTVIGRYKYYEPIDLEQIAKPAFYIALVNNSNDSVRYIVHKKVLKLSSGTFTSEARPGDQGLLLPGNSSTLLPVSDKTIVSEALLNELKKDEGLNIIFELDITYFFEHSPNKKFVFKRIIECSQDQKDILPILKLACSLSTF